MPFDLRSWERAHQTDTLGFDLASWEKAHEKEPSWLSRALEGVKGIAEEFPSVPEVRLKEKVPLVEATKGLLPRREPEPIPQFGAGFQATEALTTRVEKPPIAEESILRAPTEEERRTGLFARPTIRAAEPKRAIEPLGSAIGKRIEKVLEPGENAETNAVKDVVRFAYGIPGFIGSVGTGLLDAVATADTFKELMDNIVGPVEKAGGEMAEGIRKWFEIVAYQVSPLEGKGEYEKYERDLEEFNQTPLGPAISLYVAKGVAKQIGKIPKTRRITEVTDYMKAQASRLKKEPPVKSPIPEEPSIGKLQMEQAELLEKAKGVTEKPGDIAVRYEGAAKFGLPSIEDYLKSPTVHFRGKDAAGILLKSSNPLKSARQFLKMVAEKKSSQDVSAKKAFDAFMKKPGDPVDILNDAVEVASIIAREDFRGIYNKRTTSWGVTEKPVELHAGITPTELLKSIDYTATKIIGEAKRTKLKEEYRHRVYKGLRTSKNLREFGKTLVKALRSPSRMFSERLTRPIFEQHDAELVAHDKFMAKSWEHAQKQGIKTGTEASKLIGKYLDTDPAKVGKVEYARLEAQIKRLPQKQQEVIKAYRDTFAELWEIRGKKPGEGLTYYFTHIINEGVRNKFNVSQLIDALPPELKRPVAKLYGRWLQDSNYGTIETKPPPETLIPKSLLDKFTKRRKGALGYSYDIQEVFPIYLRHTLRKVYREPLLDQIRVELEAIKDPTEYKMANTWVNTYLGRVQVAEGMKYPGLQKLSNKLRSMIYRGTLEANPAAALLNSTQVLNTWSEIGGRWTYEGVKQLLAPEGRKIFAESGILKDLLMGRRSRPTDFFTKVEYWNRGVTFLGERARLLAEGKDLKEAEWGGKDLVRKTQFWYGLDMPQVLRGPVGKPLGMFMSYPIKQTELIASWVKNREFKKIGRFLAITYVLGGPRGLLPYKEIFGKIPFVSEEANEKIDNIFNTLEDYSVSGLLGVNMAPKFGFGIFPTGVTPIPKLGIDAVAAVKGAVKGEWYPAEKLAKYDLPMLVPGGVQARKTIGAIRNIARGYTTTQRERKRFETDVPTELKRVLVGQPLKETRSYELMGEETQERRDYSKMRQRIIDLIIKGEDTDNQAKVDRANKLNDHWNRNHPHMPIEIKTANIEEERYLKGLTSTERKLYREQKGLREKYEPKYEEIWGE